MDMCYVGIFVALISLMGFLLENLWLAITKGYIDNRNMHLPFLLGYGLLVTCFGLCFGTPDNIQFFGFETEITGVASWIIYFAVAFVIICGGEHLLGTVVEKLCGIEYWNYDWVPLKFSKYTTLPTSIGFSLVLTLFMGYAARPLAAFFMKTDETTALRISVVAVAVLFIDFSVSFGYMYKNKRLNERWRIDLRKKTD